MEEPHHIVIQGTGPWNLEVQIVGPKSLETLQFPGIAANRERLQIPIPKTVDKDGGSFDIDLSGHCCIETCFVFLTVFVIVSIEDSYGCKRSIMVPGISVNVRRVQVSGSRVQNVLRLLSYLYSRLSNSTVRRTSAVSLFWNESKPVFLCD
jgi:hypothetical protein